MSRVPLFEKYRPKKLEEVLDQEHIKSVMAKYIQRGDIPHMLFVGPPGTGKTTVAHVLAREMGWAIVEFNASDERGIQVVREDIKRLAYSKGRKIILLDEADSMTEDAQHALRRIIEKAVDARFILTANYEWRIIDAIKSRCAIFRFQKLPRELVVRRLAEIVVAEGVEVKTKEQLEELKRALLAIVDVTEGDMRKALNLLDEILASKQEITVEAIRALVRPGLVDQAVAMACNGDLDQAVAMLENALVASALDVDTVVKQMYKALLKLNGEKVKVKGLLELARAEHAIKMGGSPVIQLSGVLASLWLLTRAIKR